MTDKNNRFDGGSFLAWVLAGVAGSVMGALISGGTTPSLKDCAEQHNVYACELVAVPKVQEPKP